MNHPHPGLPYPAKLAKKTLRIVALGGLGEIGRNMTVFEYEGRLLIVDCGVLFPGDDQPGIDLILPDFSYLKDRMDDIEAIFLTHGHEDHIGAVPYLLRERSDIRIIGSQLTLAFVAPKLKERRITAPMTQVKAGQVEKVGPFTLEFVTVNHSIPDSLAVAIKTPAGVILHTGDFKMDKMPLDGKVTDLETFARLGKEGVDLFLVDSTNADVPGLTVAEKDIYPALKEAINKTPRRVVVTSFASHVHRIQQVLTAAHEANRKVAYVGRSMVRNMKLAEDLGYLKVPAGLVVDYKDIDTFGDKIVLVCTGSQGEPLAALSRIANGDFAPELVFKPFIDKLGNEKQGINVMHNNTTDTKVSGVLVTDLPNKEEKSIIFGSDKAVVIYKTYTENDFNQQGDNLIITVSKIIT